MVAGEAKRRLSVFKDVRAKQILDVNHKVEWIVHDSNVVDQIQHQRLEFHLLSNIFSSFTLGVYFKKSSRAVLS